jgi:hypothetical protein
MASTYSALKIELIATGEQAGTWGATTNVNLGDAALGEAITGSADVAFSSADVTVTLTDTNATQTARNLRLNLTGTSGGARNLILGSGCQIEKLYLVNNGLADAVTIKNTTGTGIAIPAGKSAFVFNNGTNVVDAVTYLSSLTTTQVNITGQGDLRLEDTSGGEYVALQAPTTLASSYTLTMPVDDGTSGQALITDGSGNLSWSTAASGDVYGPASATDEALARFDLTTGKLIQNSVGILSDAGILTGLTGLTSSGSITFSGLTSGRVTYATTAGLLTDSANLLYSGTDLTVYGLTVGRGLAGVSTNTAVGASALATNTSGNLNTALGFEALKLNTSGAENVAVGYRALDANLGGTNNIAMGRNALGSNTSGSANVAVGDGALIGNLTANSNSAFGNDALSTNSTGANNTAIGHSALTGSTTASNNTAVGYQAGLSNTTGTANVFLGLQSAYWNTTGGGNVSIGYGAFSSNNGSANGTGSNNVAIGRESLAANTTASQSTAIGYRAGYTNTTGQNLVAIGYQAGYTSNADNSTYVGYYAGQTTTGTLNTFVGVNGAGYLVSTGTRNTIIGGYNGNQGGLDIRTASNYIVLSDGDGNPRQIIDSSGNLGLGVTPSAWGTSWKAFQVGTNGASLATHPTLLYTFLGSNWYQNGANDKYITSNTAGILSMNGNVFSFLQAPSGTAGNNITFTQAMTLSAAGGLSIGATADAGAGNILLTGNSGTIFGSATTGARSYIELYNSSTGDMSLATTFSTANIKFLTGGTTTPTERMRIDSGGRIGFGTGGTVADRLINAGFTSVTTTGATQFGFLFNPTYPNTATANIYHTYFYPNITAGATFTNLYNLYLEGNNITGSTVANSYGVYQAGSSDKNYFAGNVGIGTINPAGKFDITGASNSTVNSYFRAYGGTSARANMILDMYTTTAGAAGNLTFQRAHDNTLGGITDVSSGDVLGNINFYGTSRGNGSYNSGGNIQVKVNGAASTYVPADMYIYTNSGSTDRSGNPQLTIHSNGTIRFLSTISVGNTAPSTSGSGITFPATQDASSDANTLDDYEEGTWTPTIIAAGGSGSPTYGSNIGKYTKIGNTVFATAFISFTKNTLSGGTLQSGGLPFAGANSYYPEAACYLNIGTLIVNPLCQVGANSTVIDVAKSNAVTGAIEGVTIANLGSGDLELRYTVTYQVN